MSFSGKRLGRYILYEELGRGGMARVFRAVDTTLQRTVALKVLAPQLSNDPEFSARFEREAVTAANMRHPNIVTVFDVGAENDMHYIAMEYVAGRTLQEIIDERGPLGLGLTITILDPVARALDHAHAQGSVHRDIKPQNIMLDADGRVVLMDFGIAQGPGSSGARLTRTGTFMGTPEYISPEQASSQPVDGRSDLYSLGVVAFELLTGTTPFTGPAPQLIIAHVYNDPPVPSAYDPALPPEVDRVFKQALAKLPDERFNKASALVSALRQIAQARGVRIPPPETLASLAIAQGSSAGKTTVRMQPGVPPAPSQQGSPPTVQGSYQQPPQRPGQPASGQMPTAQPAPRATPASGSQQYPQRTTPAPGSQQYPGAPPRSTRPPSAPPDYLDEDDGYGAPRSGGSQRYVRSMSDPDPSLWQRWSLPIIFGLIALLLIVIIGRSDLFGGRRTPEPTKPGGLSGEFATLPPEGTRIPTITPDPDSTLVPTSEQATEVLPTEVVLTEPPLDLPTDTPPVAETSTPELPTATVELPTATVELPTDTAVPPTDTAVPPTETLPPTPIPGTPLLFFADGEIRRSSNGSAQSSLVATLPDGAGPPMDLSPDGTLLALTIEQGGDQQIALLPLGGTNDIEILTSQGENWYPSWHPDGDRLLFVSDRDGNPEIYLYDLADKSETRLTNDPASDLDPSWHPKRDELVFASNRDGAWDLFTMEAKQGGKTRSLLERKSGDQAIVGQPRYSHEGKEIVYVTAANGSAPSDIYIVESNGDAALPLTNNAGESELAPRWSENDDWIAYEAHAADGSSRILLMRADGGGFASLPGQGQSPLW